ncbi:MAG: hypothetical protein BGO21_14095 [Dyadobacter sp. 50-39]|uniref:CRISPR-associated protein Cas5 n=1 Tax=Dyadobacter sp. 50-39 TaxID=1895756 RepID=UPI0009694CBE|nr:CRISPR-associated protein Cas5 [Dyadobacter sp. 50-39]OJV22398.1 MAG: hypothetical protein BGO21_14095 [Dyadobacter sp. 50-39]
MEILQIDVGGKFAHFRKYYANNTAMSFTLPPRTTLMGMLAGMLGRPRDQYYEEFASERIRIGIRVMNPVKKSFHRLNFLRVTGLNDFNGSKGRIQTPFEIVSGLDISRNEVVYRIYVACAVEGKQTFEELKLAVLNRRNKYALTFGTANFNASILSAKLFGDAQIREINDGSRLVIHSSVPSEAVEELVFDRESADDRLQFIEEELLPADFLGNGNRELRLMNRIVFSTTGHGIEVRLNRPYYEIEDDGIQRIIFLE